MKIKTSKDYSRDILKKYEEYGADFLHELKPSDIKEACIILFNQGLNLKDKEIFKAFFKVKGNSLNIIDIENFKVEKFKPIKSFLTKGTKLNSNVTLELVSILINFEPRPYSNYRSSNIEEKNQEKLPAKKTITTIKKKKKNYKKAIAFLLIFCILSFAIVLFKNKTKPTLNYVNKITTNNLFNPPKFFKHNNGNNIELIVTHTYSWKEQVISNIALDSIAIKLTLRNNSKERFYFDRIVLNSTNLKKLNNENVIESDIYINPNINFKIDTRLIPDNYVWNIISETNFNFLPPSAETDLTIMVTGMKHNSGVVELIILVDGHTYDKPMQVRSNKIVQLGF